MNVKLEILARRKKESRDIVKKIIDFGVSESQKYDIMFNLALTLENNTALKNISKTLKNYIDPINNDQEVNKIETSNKNKIIIE